MKFRLDPLSPSGISSVDPQLVAVINTGSSSGGSGAVSSVNGQTGAVVLDADDIDDTSTTNKYVTASDLVNLSNLSGTNSGDVSLTGEDYLSLSSQQITANPIDLDNLSATGTPSSATFLRGDNSWATPAGSGDVSKVGTPLNNQVGVWTGDGTIEGDTALTFDTSTDTLSTVNIAPSGTVDGRDVATDGTKLDGIESGADVTDATNVDAAGATMNTDTSLAGNGYFLDEDNMSSNSATKVPSQQSVKAYVDAINTGVVDSVVAGSNIDVDATDPANPIVSVENLVVADITDLTATATELNYTDGVTSAIQTQLDAKQPLDSDLTTIAGLTATTDNVIQSVGSAWSSRTPSQLKSTLSLSKSDVGLGNVDNTSDSTKNSASVTLTNKTIDLSSNSLSGTTAQFNTALSDNDFATIAGSETLTNKTLTTPTIAQINNSSAPGVKLQLRTQTDNSESISSATTAGLIVQYGWGQKQGVAATTMSDAVTFPTAFSTVLGVTISFAGQKATTSAADITELTTSTASTSGLHVHTSDITTSGFSADFGRTAGNFSTSAYYGYSWVAWGV